MIRLPNLGDNARAQCGIAQAQPTQRPTSPFSKSPTRQCGDSSSSTYTRPPFPFSKSPTRQRLCENFENPTNAVGGLFRHSLKSAQAGLPFPFLLSLASRGEKRRQRGAAGSFACRLGMNDPPTELVGFGEGIWRASLCRLGMNDPPTELVGFGEGIWRASSCRLGMNDPPTARG